MPVNVEIPEKYLTSPRFCPVCQSGSESFGLYGDAGVPDARCPNCTTMERYRLLYLYLLNETDFFAENNTVLDIAPRREFAQVCRKTRSIDYVSMDLVSPRAMVKSDITAISLPSNVFNYIFCYHVLEHVPEQPALKEIYRVVKPGGKVFIQVPIDIALSETFEVPGALSQDYERLYGQKDHVRVYGQNFGSIIEAAGFTVCRVKYIENFTAALRIKLGLKDTYQLKNYTTCEDIFIASK